MTKEARIYNGEKTVSSVSSAGKTGQLMQKNETGTLPNTIHKSKLKIDQGPKCKPGHCKTLRGKHRKDTL